VKGATVIDLFAGSGALGIEALSRGASRCTFVERSPAALAVIRTNLETTRLVARAELVQADATAWVARARPVVDLCLTDPPYAFDEWSELLGHVDAEVVVVESDRPVELPPTLVAIRGRRYGGTVVTLGRSVGRAEESQA
jgi:16S rRNA (guanine966-N2)-methyltransferase